MYRVEAVSAVKKDMRKLPRAVTTLLEHKYFPALKLNPRVGEPLHQEFKGLWSYHFSHLSTQYRIVYEIDEVEPVIYVLLIGTRENLYDRLRRRVR